MNKIDLTPFYREIQKCIDGGPKPKWLCTRYGLCTNSTKWAKYYRISPRDARSALTQSFTDAGLDDRMPFNAYIREDVIIDAHAPNTKLYVQESTNGDRYKNPYRLAWIKKHANMDSIEASEILQEFYDAMYRALFWKKQSKKWIHMNRGLCYNLRRYVALQRVRGNVSMISDSDLTEALHKQFIDAGLCNQLPFNNGSLAEYDAEDNKYMNEKRLEWIRSHSTIRKRK